MIIKLKTKQRESDISLLEIIDILPNQKYTILEPYLDTKIELDKKYGTEWLVESEEVEIYRESSQEVSRTNRINFNEDNIHIVGSRFEPTEEIFTIQTETEMEFALGEIIQLYINSEY